MNKKELLNKYLAKKLTSEETEEFNTLKKSDAGFLKEVSFHDDLAKVLMEDERRRLKSILSNRKQGKLKNNRSKIILIVIIGLVLILASIFTIQYQKNQKSPKAIYAAYFEPYPNSYRPVSRNSNDNAETQGFTAYENGNYELAAEKFELSIKEKQDLSIIFYQGICFGATDNLIRAIQNMERVKGKSFPYSTESYWYLGLYHLKQNNYDEAINHFQNYIKLTDDQEKIQKATIIIGNIMRM